MFFYLLFILDGCQIWDRWLGWSYSRINEISNRCGSTRIQSLETEGYYQLCYNSIHISHGEKEYEEEILNYENVLQVRTFPYINEMYCNISTPDTSYRVLNVHVSI